YTKSGIDKRHTVINDFQANGDPRLFFQQSGTLSAPSTGKRNEHYTREAKTLFTEAARKSIEQNPEVGISDITHVITVSCTGFFAPEPAFEIIKELKLDPSTERYHLGFMGCFAAFPAMKMARSFCEAQPDATVLVACLELCTLHLQNSEIPDQLISASVFADGAAGMIISSRPPARKGYRIDRLATSIAEDTEQEMAWTIGDTGFDMVLSSYVPDLIKTNLKEATRSLFENHKINRDEIDYWAVHPGGRAILDKIQHNFELHDDQLGASREVLANYGNMSSATVLFVLAELLKHSMPNNEASVLSIAFGPGLTIESALLTRTNNGT